jgi:2-(1,2-epoxy-1,2-dihydrophenyl)acetyl-CoA isomerase
MGDSVLYEVGDGLATVTLNRPEAMNALDTGTKDALRDSLRAAAADEAVRAVLLTGRGKAFCVGQDLKEHVGILEAGGGMTTVAEHYNPIALAIATMPKPVVAAVNGVAAGAGASIALACDLVVAARSASFIQAFSRLGLVPDSGATWFLPRLVGRARALGLALLGERLSARDAADWGLIWRCVDDADFAAAVDRLAGELAAAPTRGLVRTREAMAAAATATLAGQLDLERDFQRELGLTSDYAEGVAAFAEKRAPRFTGR